jgi:Flp pilus assembly protein TadG
MKATSMSSIWLRAQQSAVSLWHDHKGIAATEFAMIVPLMLVTFFGTVEFSSGLDVDRKVTLASRTLSDLTSQSSAQSLTDTYMQNVFTSTMAILQPYLATPGNARISQVYVNSSGVATIQWSEAATFPAGAQQATLTPSTRNAGDIVTTQVPAALLVKQTFLIWSEVSYLYKPAVGYVMVKGGVTLSDFAYSRPRQYTCLFYNTFIPPFTNPIANPSTNCPMS